MRALRWLLSSTLAVSIAAVGLPSSVAQAAPSAAEKKAIDEAKDLYEKGRTAFDMADYDEAIALWKEAYAKLPDGPDAVAIKNSLVFNISEAQVRAYEIDKNVMHLRKARVLLSDYLRNHEELYGTDKDAIQERAEAQARLEEIDEMIAGADASGGPGPGPDDAKPEPSEKKDDGPSEAESRDQQERAAREARMQEIQTDPELRKQDAANKKRIVTGAVLGGIGITFLAGAYVTYSVGAAAPAPTPTNPTPTASLSTGALVATLVLGLAGLGLTGAGAGLFATGMKKRKQLRAPKPSAQSMVVPWASPRGGGATLTVRF
jgi:tetratricopeptide (TPR) repeat protein